MAEIEPQKSPAQTCYLIHDSNLQAETRQELAALGGVTFLSWGDRETPSKGARVLLYLGDEMLRDTTVVALERQWVVGVLPHPEAQQAMAAMGVSGNLKQVFEHYLKTPAIQIDALTCNGELVFSSVVIGKVLALRPLDISRQQTTWSILVGALRGLGKLRLLSYTLTTGKEMSVRLAALGMVVVGQNRSKLVGRAFTTELGAADSRLSLLALSPRSIVSYLWFLLRMLWPKKINLSQLPGSLGLIQTDRLHITAPEGAVYLLDGKPVHASDIQFSVHENRLNLLPGPAMSVVQHTPVPVYRDTVRVNNIPSEDRHSPLLNRNLPLFSHATEEEFRDLFMSLRDNARASSSYQVLMVLSVLLALAGLYANSAPVIIGAMILAPLMSPIVPLAMGLARTEPRLIQAALRTLLVGVAWGLICAICMAWLMPLDMPTAEMKARTAPTLLDLLVAVISGIACAYANVRSDVAKSLAGVAIAVALVPPLSVVGIGVGWGDWEMAAGAALLLVTNLVGIALAASATFLVLGFAPFKRAHAGLGIALLILLVISVPLSMSFYHLVNRENLLEHVPSGDVQLSDLLVHVDRADVTLGRPPLVFMVLSSREPMTASHVDELKAVITRRLGEPIELEVQSNIRR